MKIEELLDNLLHKIYGKEVRQSFVDAIRQCYKDATGHPESVAAIIKENEELSKKITTEISDRESSIKNEETDRKSEIDVERKRIDNIVTGAVSTTKFLTVESASEQFKTAESAQSLDFTIKIDSTSQYADIINKNPQVVSVEIISSNGSPLAFDELNYYFKTTKSSDRFSVNVTGKYRIGGWAGASTATLLYNAKVIIAYNDEVVDTSSAELADIRVGADGEKYDTAGEAVRQQIGSLKEDLKNVIVTDGSITTEKIANEAITIDKLDPNISNMLNGDKGLTAEQKRYIIMLFKNAVFSKNMVDTVTALEDSFNTIPATGIKLNPATIKFASIGDTQKITATLTPDTATSSIIWESNNTDVVTVQNGVATAVNDGMATITATSGSATTKCNVTVNTKELYSVSNKVCNADFYEATGLRFGSDTANGLNKSWTLFINCSVTAGKIVYGVNSNIGDIMDLAINGAKACRVSNAKGVYGANCSSNDIVAYVLIHEANSFNISVYQYINEEVTNQTIYTAYKNLSDSVYNGEVYIGGKTNADYVGTIYDFSIIMRKATESEIETYLKGCVY